MNVTEAEDAFTPPSVPPFPGGQKSRLSASIPVANFVQSGVAPRFSASSE